MGVGVISYNTLNRDLVKALKTHAIPENELPQVQEQMRQTIAQQKKDSLVGKITLAVFGLALIAFAVYHSVQEGTEIGTTLSVVAYLAAFIAALYPLTAYLDHGLMKQQYNSALKKGYPDQADLYKL